MENRTLYHMKSHTVIARPIKFLVPLTVPGSGQMLSPTAGLTLVLSDDSSRNWMGGGREDHIPEVGDWFITDDKLGISFVFPSTKFREMFWE